MIEAPGRRLGTACRLNQSMDARLVENTRSNSAVSSVSIPSRCFWYAAFSTRMSSPPRSSSVRCTASAQNSSFRTSPGSSRALRPASRTSAAVLSASSCSSGRCTIAMSAPSRAYAIATARPIPESPPVISARLPSSLP